MTGVQRSPQGRVPWGPLLAGVKAGVAASVPVVALSTTQTPEALRDAGASVIVPSYTGLVPGVTWPSATPLCFPAAFSCKL